MSHRYVAPRSRSQSVQSVPPPVTSASPSSQGFTPASSPAVIGHRGEPLTANAGGVGAGWVVVGVRPASERLPAPPWVRPRFFTSMWKSSPGRECSYRTAGSSPIRPSRPIPHGPSTARRSSAASTASRRSRPRSSAPAERNDHGDAIRRGAVVDPTRSGRPIGQTRFALDPVAANLLTCTTHADPGGLGRRPQRPSLIHDPTSKHTPPAPAERQRPPPARTGRCNASQLGPVGASSRARMRLLVDPGRCRCPSRSTRLVGTLTPGATRGHPLRAGLRTRASLVCGRPARSGVSDVHEQATAPLSRHVGVDQAPNISSGLPPCPGSSASRTASAKRSSGTGCPSGIRRAPPATSSRVWERAASICSGGVVANQR
jgi:hypothetical protein